MLELSSVISDSFETVTAQIEDFESIVLTDETNVFDLIDSFSVVDLLLETESQIEVALGRYVALGDETVFDAEKSPLKRWGDWVAYVGACCGK